MAENRPIVFADGVIEAQVAHGVARVTLAMTGSDGTATPCATLCVPVTQLPALVNGMGNLLKQIEDRVRAQVAQQQQQAVNGDSVSAPGAFRFQS